MDVFVTLVYSKFVVLQAALSLQMNYYYYQYYYYYYYTIIIIIIIIIVVIIIFVVAFTRFTCGCI